MSEFNNNYHKGYEPENDSVSGSFSRPNTNSYSSSRYNSFSDSSGYTNFNQQGTANEFYYSPHKPSAGKGKKALTAIIAVLSIVALGTTSLVCYTLITGNNPVSPQTAASAKADENESKAEDDSAGGDDSSKIDRKNLPTIAQLATPSDAMAIPDIVTKVSPSVVGVSCILSQGTATGSGIIMSADGYIITNAHVVDGAKSVSVLLPKSYAKNSSTKEEDLTYKATIVGKDTQTDIAVLKIDAKDLTACEFGKSSEIKVGEISIVIGNPLGFSLANSVTSGIISAKDRVLTVQDRTMNLIQTDASINNGNSGGPLINAYGQVIGITSAKVSSTYGEGLGFAIPIDEAMPVIKSLMENGYVKRPSLGVAGRNVSATYAEYYNIPRGYQVVTVTKGSGAEKAGVKPNDIIIGINDTSVSTLGELNVIKNKCKIGDTVKLTIYRDGKMIDLNVTLDEAKSSEEDTTKSSERDYSQQYKSYSDLFRDYLNNF
jgi:serine protease Do